VNENWVLPLLNISK